MSKRVAQECRRLPCLLFNFISSHSSASGVDPVLAEMFGLDISGYSWYSAFWKGACVSTRKDKSLELQVDCE